MSSKSKNQTFVCNYFTHLESNTFNHDVVGQENFIILLGPGQDFDDINLNFRIVKKAGALNLLVIVFGNSRSQNVNIDIFHKKGKSKSRINVNCLADGDFNAGIFANVNIPQNCRGAETVLKSESLLFSSKAKVKILPGLNIVENDVKASHTASISKFDEDEKFYLENRGLDNDEIQDILLHSFISKSLFIFEDIVPKEYQQLYDDVFGNISQLLHTK